VFEIDYSGATGVLVRARDAFGEEFEYAGSAVIVTVSIGVLEGIAARDQQTCGGSSRSGGGLFYPPFNLPNNITFKPELPANKREAIRVTGMGVYNKLVVQYDRTVLPAALYMFANVQPDLVDLGLNFTRNVHARLTSLGKIDLANKLALDRESVGNVLRTHIFFNNEFEGKPAGTLSMDIGGDWGLIFEEFTDLELTMMLHAVLQRCFGVAVQPLNGIASRWSQDMATGGSYCYPRLGRQYLGIHPIDTFDIMAQPVGNNRVLFAGEATSRLMHQTVHGALSTGLREAARLTGDWTAYENATRGAILGRKSERMRRLRAAHT